MCGYNLISINNKVKNDIITTKKTKKIFVDTEQLLGYSENTWVCYN